MGIVSSNNLRVDKSIFYAFRSQLAVPQDGQLGPQHDLHFMGTNITQDSGSAIVVASCASTLRLQRPVQDDVAADRP